MLYYSLVNRVSQNILGTSVKLKCYLRNSLDPKRSERSSKSPGSTKTDAVEAKKIGAKN